MAKDDDNYITELANWVAKQQARRRPDKNVVAFIAAKEDVRSALAAGYAMKTVWDHMTEKGRISFRYETFTQYVRKHLTAASPPKTTPLTEASVASATEASVAQPIEAQRRSAESPIAAPVQRPNPSAGGFTFSAAPNKQELI